MRDDTGNVIPTVEETQDRQALKFFYTPLDAFDAKRAERENPHAKATTHVPEVVEALREAFGEAVTHVEAYAGEHTVFVDRARIVDVCRFLKEEQQFTYLCDLGAIDRFTDEDRFEVFYNLVSMARGRRLRLKVRVGEDDPTVPSVTPVYRAANWNEREAWDMMGIRFDGHPDLRRMYMPEDFEHHPQRKEFPQLGIPGSLPLPPRTPEGELNYDPFIAAHEGQTPRSYEEPRSDAGRAKDDDH